MVDLHVAPLPERPDHVVVMLQERTIADKMDRQLTHRGAARSVIALAAMLAHEIKNPLSGIRGAAQLLEQSVGDEDRSADAADLRRGRPHRQARRPHGSVRRRTADRARARQHPRGARTREAAGAIRALRATSNSSRTTTLRCRRFWPTATSSIQVFLNLVKNAAEAIGESAIDGEIGLIHRFPAGRAAGRAGQQDARLAAAGILRQGQRPGRARGPAAASLRSVRDDEADRHLASDLHWWRRSSATTAASSNANRSRDDTIFRVLMPMYRGDDAAPRGSLPREGQLMPAGNILVADDDAAIRTVLNQALSRAGYEVRSTSNAATLGAGSAKARAIS